MSQTERLVLMAEDELTQYSTDARKIERLRRKIGISVPPAQQKQVKEELLAEMPDNFLGKLVEEQRQTVALPFWGIAGLGLLFGISLRQPVDFLAPAIAFPIAFNLQKWGWRLQAKRLVINTLEEIENGVKSGNSETNK
ncbi:MAG: hypothetical protein QNJ41_11610 [Xenococcaceae cyanobacterium MO_188.B32]|nr:hypothetical protein [Xenococcaceae cyanobacterium MO_188.B32]